MRKLQLYFLFILFSFKALYAQTQVREKPELSSFYSELLVKLKQCDENSTPNCTQIIEDLIQQGKKDKVIFLDYLYFNISYWYVTQSKYDSAKIFAQKALENPNPNLKFRSDLDVYNILGNCAYIDGNLNEAIDFYVKAAKILESGEISLKLGYLYSNIAILLGETKNDKKQLEYLQKSYRILDELNDEKFIATVASNMALNYLYLADTINVQKWAEKALEISKKTNDLVAETLAYNALSRIQKNQEKALGLAQKSYNAAKLEGNPIHLATSTTQYAEALYKANKKEEAFQFAQESVRYANDAGDKSILIRSLKNAGNLYFENGQKDLAAQYFQQYISINDSIMGVDIPKQINEINTKYETEKKEKQIAEQDLKIQKQTTNFWIAILGGLLLASILGGVYYFNRKANQNKLIQLQSEKENAILNSFIQGEERERNRISHELHDGVAAMLGAAKMSIESIPHLPPDKQNEQLVRIKTILENTHADVRHIAHNLLPTVLEKEGLIKATEHFATELNASKLIQISVVDHDSNANELKPQLQLMLFRVIQELINNTIKHSQAKIAQIEFSRNDNGLQIEVSDDGIGFDGDVNDGNQGLYSISQRLKSIGGNFKFIRKSDRGMKAVAELKV